MSSYALEECMAALELAGPGLKFQRKFDSAKRELLADPEIPSEILGSISIETGQAGPIFVMLGTLLNEARMALNDGEHGQAFLDDMASAIHAGRMGNLLTPMQMGAIAGEYRRADLAVPDILILDELDTPIPDGIEDFDPTLQLTNLADQIMNSGGDAYAVFSALSEMSAALPEGPQAGMVHHLATIDGEVFERCALYMILSGTTPVQEATLEGLMDRLNSGSFAPETMRLLPMMRGWMAKGELQDKLDSLIKAARKKDISLIPAPKSSSTLKILASVADGVGAQSLMIKIGRGRKSRLAVLLLKDGYGIKDAFVAPQISEEQIDDAMENLEDEADGRKISLETLKILLEGGLMDGKNNNCLPAPGVLDVIGAVGLFDIRPQALSLQALLDRTDPSRKIQDATPKSLERWMRNMECYIRLGDVTTSWYEDTADTRALLQSDKGEEQIAENIWDFLETRRDLWARRFLHTALIMNPKTNSYELRLLVASAFSLVSGHPIQDNGLMQGVFVTTMSAAGYEVVGIWE